MQLTVQLIVQVSQQSDGFDVTVFTGPGASPEAPLSPEELHIQLLCQGLREGRAATSSKALDRLEMVFLLCLVEAGRGRDRTSRCKFLPSVGAQFLAFVGSFYRDVFFPPVSIAFVYSWCSPSRAVRVSSHILCGGICAACQRV